jgi:hypothetical protein
MGGSRTILSTSPGRHLRQRTFGKYNMPKHTIFLHYLKGNDTDSNLQQDHITYYTLTLFLYYTTAIIYYPEQLRCRV